MKEFEQFEKQYKTFTGWLMSDIEIKYYESGKVNCKFTIPLKQKKEDEPVFLNCITWNPVLAETLSERYAKGSEITVIGYFTQEEYNNKTYTKFNVKMAM